MHAVITQGYSPWLVGPRVITDHINFIYKEEVTYV